MLAFHEWCRTWATEALRVLKPGGHILAFGGTRTYHRLTCAIEDAGFEIRDCLAYMFGSGFPKSLDVSKAIDKAAGAERTEVIGVKPGHEEFIERTDAHAAGGKAEGWDRPWKDDPEAVAASHMRYAPATPEAAQWEGWGTALKPAFEPIVLARKPLVGTVAANVLKHGTGALNIDGCRIGVERRFNPPTHKGETAALGSFAMCDGEGTNVTGRWPANVLLDEEAAAMLDEQTGASVSGSPRADRGRGGIWSESQDGVPCGPQYGDSSGASRFFYTSKASRSDRGEGNTHPTVKPVDLMRWLVRLVTPPDGIVLDPFAGSGTTLQAAIAENRKCIGIEKDDHYCELIVKRLERPIQVSLLGA